MREQLDPALLWFMVLSQGVLGYGLTSVFGAIPAEIFQAGTTAPSLERCRRNP